MIPQKENAGTMVPDSSSTSSPLSEKDLPPLFLLRRLLRFLLGSLFLGLRFCCLFLLGRFLLRRFFARVLRRRSPAPLPRFRRSLRFRPPAPRRLPAGTARCRLRNCPSRFPFHPPLGESLAPVCKGGPRVAVLAGVT